jgi:hypothetical protein
MNIGGGLSAGGDALLQMGGARPQPQQPQSPDTASQGFQSIGRGVRGLFGANPALTTQTQTGNVRPLPAPNPTAPAMFGVGG